MKSNRFHVITLETFLRKKKIATMAELKAVLSTDVDMTVFRKLQKLGYRTSYSHRGKYYALDSVAQFDQQGLWFFKSVLFSVFGTLIETVKTFVNKSEAGYFARELQGILSIEVKEPLLRLFKDKHIHREKFFGQYIYLSVDPSRQIKQKLFRRDYDFSPVPLGGIETQRSDLSVDEIKAAIILFYSLLDEKQRRLYVGLESLKLGYGGDKKIAELLDIDPHTVSKGRKELLSREVESKRVRRKGSGRNSVKKNSGHHRSN